MTVSIVDEIRELIDIDVPDSAIEHNYVKTADVIIADNLAAANLSTTTLHEIRKYLAAHFASIYAERGGLVRDGLLNSQTMYSDVYTAGFGSTRFGQMAILLDTSGTLAGIGSGKLKAQFRVL